MYGLNKEQNGGFKLDLLSNALKLYFKETVSVY